MKTTDIRMALGAFLLVVMSGAPSVAQEVGKPGNPPVLAPPRFPIPESIRIEHDELREALDQAASARGRTGLAAREVLRVLAPHFEREEQVALPPLGLLLALSRGEATAEMRGILPMTDSLKAEMGQMLEEHRRIRAAVQDLERSATAESHSRYVRLAREVMLHALTEEQVLYPAAILVGEYLKLLDARAVHMSARP